MVRARHKGRSRRADSCVHRLGRAFPPGGGFPGLADLASRLALSGACVSAEPATLFARLDAFGSRSILAAFDATRFEVFSSFAMTNPRLRRVFNIMFRGESP